jgi:hypothetical protein
MQPLTLLGRTSVASAICAATAVLLFAAYLYRFKFGLIAFNYGDWANHMILVDVISSGQSFTSESVMSRIGDFAIYPHASHYAAAWLARTTGVLPLQAIHLVANAATIASACLAGLRLFAIVRGAPSITAACIASAVGIGVLYLFASWGLGYSGQLQWNYFYPQAVGTAIALAILVGFQYVATKGGNLALVLATPLTAFLLALFHPTPAVWLGACGVCCVLSCAGNLIRRAAEAALTGLLSVAAMLSIPSFRWLLGFVGPSGIGDVSTSDHRFNLTYQPAMLATALAVLGLALIAAIPLRGYREVLRIHAGAVAVLACGVGAAVMLFATGATQYYSVAKYSFIYSAELALVAANLALGVRQAGGSKDMQLAGPVAAIALVAIPVAALMQKPYVTAFAHDQQRLIRVRAEAEAGRLTTVPRDLDNVERYYVAVSLLGESMGTAVDFLFGKR